MAARVVSVNAEAGDEISEGQLLVSMDDAELRAELARAQASVALAEVNLNHARKNNERVKRWSMSETVAEDAVDKAEHQVQVAAQQLLIAGADVARTESLLKEMRVLAPFDAVVTDRNVEVGHLAAPGESLLAIEDHTRLRFKTQVKEKDIPHIDLGDTAQLHIDALDADITGVVSRIIPSGNASHGFTVELDLNRVPRLFPGMFGKVKFTTAD